VDVSFIVPIPREITPEGATALEALEGTQVPVYVRLYVDASQEDTPGG